MTVSKDMREVIKAHIVEDKLTLAKIAKAVNLPDSTVRVIVQNYHLRGTIEPKKGMVVHESFTRTARAT